jgi:hypothetical protein
MHAMQPSKFGLNALSWQILETRNLGCYSWQKQDFGLIAIINKDSSDIPSVYVHSDDHRIDVWETC